MRFIFAPIFGTLALLMPFSAMAADNPGSAANGSYNPVLIGLLCLVVVLGFAIALLGNVLYQLAFVYRDKLRNESSARARSAALGALEEDTAKPSAGPAASVLLLLLALGFSVPSLAQDAAKTVEGVAAEVPVSPFISGIARADFYFLMGTLAFELLLVLALLMLVRNLVRVLRNIPEKAPAVKGILSRNLLDVFNSSVAVEKEEEILLDHDYDGIHELDNSLPPWWKYGFYFTILVAFVYIWYYHFGGGPSQQQEYIASVQQAEVQQAEYLAKHTSNVDEHTVTLVVDAAELGNAQTVFQNTCAACHAKDGGGAVGPNLTDNFWLHGGGLKDVFKSIKYGWAEKGMPAWKNNLSPKQVAAVASYIMSMKGTHPASPKPAQGEPYVEQTDQAPDTASAVKKPALAVAGFK